MAQTAKMAATGVLPFVRGIDLTRNDFQEDYFPKAVAEMTGLRWLRLNRTNIDWIPDELQSLKKLETLSLVRNNLVTLHGEVPALPCLRSLNCRHNRLKNSGVPPQIFDLEDLSVVDLSYNDLREIPTDLEHARGLLVLNLAYNRIENIPHQLFVSLVDLIHLDLSGNQLETLPPQMRRLVSLQTLVLNDNPLGHYQLRQLPALTSLQVLHMRNTQRTVINTPVSLDSSAVLSDVDFSQNGLPRIPDVLYTLSTLRRLNLSDNAITEVSPVIGDVWKNLRTLNLSRNKLTSLPAALCKLTTLTRLYLNDNQLDFDGIPSGIGKLHNLEVFMAAHNNLEMIPEGVVRCGRLKKLVLCHNRLITLPEAIHLLTDLEVLDLKDNPDLVMPPKPLECQRGAGTEFYNVDFSLGEQLRLAAPTAQMPAPTPVKDPIARKMRLRRRREGEADSDQAKILKGMTDVAKEKDRRSGGGGGGGGEDRVDSLKPKRWDEALEKPPIDYSEIFEEDVGQMPGIFVWEIDNFLPNPLDDSLVGKFHEGDCYIVLKTFVEETQNLNWHIYYWIGAETTLDKKACAAIHAVNLRNFLGAHCRTVREEQGDESPEFLLLFGGSLNYRKGNRASSGFYNVEEVEYVAHLYRLQPQQHRLLHIESVAVEPASLDPRYVFVLDAGRKIFVWSGRFSKSTMVSKGRLLAEKINKNERKNYSEVITCPQSEEDEDFWKALGGPPEPGFEPTEHVPENFTPAHPCLYRVGLGMGYLELPQVEVPEGKLTQSLLDTKHVYILDCNSELFVWLGKRSTRLVRAAALKLCQELLCMIHRPVHALLNRCQEGTESMVFKSKFVGWDDVIAVDFTRTAESVARTGADLQKWMSTQKTKTDLSALFMPRQPAMSKEEATQLMEEWNDDLEAMEAFVLEGKKFVKLPEEELGHFYSADCYVFLCRYWVPAESPAEGGAAEHPAENKDGDEEDEEEEEEELEDDYTCVVYFWQGRDAGNMGWLTFTFSLQKKFEALFGEKLQVLRTHQQQENLKFLSHFKRKFIIHKGSRKKPENGVELFHLRANGSPICTRCVQIPATASNLNSAFCYILKVPFEQDGEDDGMVYVWIGNEADEDDVRLAEELARSLYGSMEYSIVTVAEGEEPENFFWVGLGGKAPYDEEADFLQHVRLFRCSNEKGYFAISEKCADFCQDDLADDDIMILDNGAQVFLWVGSRCSEVEVKLAYKSAQVYVQNLRVKQPELPRKLMLTVKGKESRRFTKCFHGWGAHKTVAE